MNDELLRDGDYARKQIYCPSRIVRWSHGSRFELARQLVAPHAGGRLLDYGCGDGTFVAMTHGDFREAVGLAVPIVAIYLVLNAIVIVHELLIVWQQPAPMSAWFTSASASRARTTAMSRAW